MRTPAALLLALFVLGGAGLLAACSDPGEEAPSPRGGFDVIQPEHREPPAVDAPWRGAGDTIEVSVWEMHCAGCEGSVEKAVSAIEGVAGVEADHTSSLVRIRIEDPDRREALLPALRDAIHAAGKQVVGEDPLDAD